MFALRLAAALFLVLAGCETEERIIRYDPFLARIDKAQTQTPPVMDTQARPDMIDPSTVGLDELRIRNPDGTISIRSAAIRHCMINLALCLQAGEDELLYEQVVSEETKRHFRTQEGDPRAATLAFVKDNYGDLMALFQRMPAAERSPGVTMSKQGPGKLKLELAGPPAEGLKLTTLWVVMERGNWRFWWVT
ncbi:MAG: hypothetical protein ACT4PL_05070 [Phycisphaerales bacterium]